MILTLPLIKVKSERELSLSDLEKRRRSEGRTQSGTGNRSEVPEDGVVLHQPLNRAIFRIFGKKARKMNGIPVCLVPKTQNAPTWQVEKQARERPISCVLEPGRRGTLVGGLVHTLVCRIQVNHHA